MSSTVNLRSLAATTRAALTSFSLVHQRVTALTFKRPTRLPNWSGRYRPAPPSDSDWRMVGRIKVLASELHELSDTKLSDRAKELRDSVVCGELAAASDAVIERGFPLVNESVRRSLGWQYYDVQFLAAMSLTRGEIAEMATGEGKTLVQALAAFVLSLTGNGVHVMTSNAFLAARDCSQLSPVLGSLGLSVGLLRSQATMQEKRAAYEADVTFGPGYEFGFDYLRDQVGARQQQTRLGDSLRRNLRAEEAGPRGIQRGHSVAIVDEADSVMIDEATTPLCLSAAPTELNPPSAPYVSAADVAARLQVEIDFVVKESERSVKLTNVGLSSSLVTKSVPVGEKLDRPWTIYVEQALAARHLFCRDVDYVVDQDKVVLVDQSTGRLFKDRSLQQGLHQAIEAKEQVAITAPHRTEARISRQQFFQLYATLGGMTGTASDAEREFREIYKRSVRLIPTRKPCRRVALPTRFFASCRAKREAVVEEILTRHSDRQPVLVGTRTIEESLEIANMLTHLSVPMQLLNGTQDLDEADVIAGAGEPGSVTIATNIAGRGTDIRLGPGVEELGGLHVIATEVHASPRVDRQLIGRTARQGNPGSCQVFVSADDELLRFFSPQLIRTIRRLAPDGGEVQRDLSSSVAALQRRVEKKNFEKRRQLLRQGAWVEDVLSKLTGNAERE